LFKRTEELTAETMGAVLQVWRTRKKLTRQHNYYYYYYISIHKSYMKHRPLTHFRHVWRTIAKMLSILSHRTRSFEVFYNGDFY